MPLALIAVKLSTGAVTGYRLIHAVLATGSCQRKLNPPKSPGKQQISNCKLPPLGKSHGDRVGAKETTTVML